MIYENVKKACAAKGITISKLEEDLKISKGGIWKWKEHEPSAARVKAVADYLEVTVDELLKE